ncbi:hypothetical protein [Spongiactinospora sp. 9N601]|uniref:hypothetical protein n=1 Tax=Spongiactinospora sp. 9N601 TaxID=3375149 RepID=UPI003790C05F
MGWRAIPTLIKRQAVRRQIPAARRAELAARPGASITALMAEFGRSRGAIRSRLERLGVSADLPHRANMDSGATDTARG